MKEAIAVIRLELAKGQLDLQDTLNSWEICARYCVAMHNLHGKLEGTGRTGKEKGIEFPPCFVPVCWQKRRTVFIVLDVLFLLVICTP